MPPADKFNYENEYTKHVGAHGYVRCKLWFFFLPLFFDLTKKLFFFNYYLYFTLVANFDELYQRLGIPREECIAAWF